MHNLILNKIKLNDNIDDHFEDLQKRHHNIFDGCHKLISHTDNKIQGIEHR